MTPRRNRRQKKSLLSKARWAGYAAAGAVTVLGAHESADADIHHFDIDPDAFLDGSLGLATNTDSYFIKFSPDQNPQDILVMKHWGFTYQGAPFGAAEGTGILGQIAGFQAGGYTYVYNLQFGDLVSARQFQARGTLAYFTGVPSSEFGSPGPGYVGFRFNAGAGTQYGWLQVMMPGTADGHNAYSILDYAYADPGESITAGQVPEPGSLGLLATGAAGLLLWRLKRRGSKPAA